MNLAQTVDPETKRISPQWFAPIRFDGDESHIPKAIAATITAVAPEMPKPGTLQRSIYEVLRERGPMTFPQLRELFPKRESIGTCLGVLYGKGLVEKKGTDMKYLWSATD